MVRFDHYTGPTLPDLTVPIQWKFSLQTVTNTYKVVMGNDNTQSTGPYFKQSSC